eukprot:7936199-Pyramimonas_sp.AAC.1
MASPSTVWEASRCFENYSTSLLDHSPQRPAHALLCLAPLAGALSSHPFPDWELQVFHPREVFFPSVCAHPPSQRTLQAPHCVAQVLQ